MIIATRYTIEQIEGVDAFKIRNQDAPFCPICGALCSGYDSRARRVVDDDGQPTCYQLHRVRCPSCDVLHIELPDFMRPQKHYAAAVIDKAVDCDCSGNYTSDCPADNSTIWRWRKNHPPGLQCLSCGNAVQSGHSDSEEDGQ